MAAEGFHLPHWVVPGIYPAKLIAAAAIQQQSEARARAMGLTNEQIERCRQACSTSALPFEQAFWAEAYRLMELAAHEGRATPAEREG